MIRPREAASENAGQGRRDYAHAWLIVVGVGALVIAVANRFFGGEGPDPTLAWVVAGILSLLMVGHALVSRGNTHVLPDTKADGIYYQGLLFTFGSLVAALIAFGSGDGAGEVTGAVITNFGVALITTIVGLIGRVWFALSAGAAGEIQESAIRELDLAVDAFKGRVRRANDGMENLNTHLQQTAKLMEETAGTAQGTLEGLSVFARRVAGTAQDFAEGHETLRKEVLNLAEEIVKVQTPVREAIRTWQQVEEGARIMDGTVERARRATNKLERDGAVAAGDLATLRSQVASARDRLRGVEAAADQLIGGRDDIERLRSASNDLRSQVVQTRITLVGVADQVGPLGGDAQQMRLVLAETAPQVDAARRESALCVEGIKGLNLVAVAGKASTFRDQVEDLEKEVARVRRQLVNIGRALERFEVRRGLLGWFATWAGRLGNANRQERHLPGADHNKPRTKGRR